MKIKYILISFLMLFVLLGCTANNTQGDAESNRTTASDNNDSTNADNNRSTTTGDNNESTNTDSNITTTSKLETLTLSNSTLNIISSSQSESLTLYGYSDIGTSNISTTLLIKYPQNILDKQIDIGYIEPTINILNGKADFVYTGPNNIDTTISNLKLAGVSNPVIVNIFDENSNVNINLSISFTGEDYSTYKLTVLPTDIIITDVSQNRVIDLYLEDNNSRAVHNELILLDYFDGSKGTMNSFREFTDINGHVAFNYTAPTTIVDGALGTMIFRSENTTLIPATTVLTVNTVATSKDYTGYVISLVDINRTITLASQVEKFDIYLKDNNNAPAEGEVVTIDFFDGRFGTVNTFSGTTDTNGYVSFTYTAPVDLSTLNGSTVTFRVESTTIEATSTLFVQNTIIQKPKIHLESSQLTITQDAQTIQVKIFAFNDNNAVFNSGTLVIKYPKEIVDDNISGGKFIQSEVSIVNGEAIFDFIGPDNLADIDDLEYEFFYKDDETIKATLTIKYSPPVATVFLATSTKELTINNQVLEIEVGVIDEKNNPYLTGSVKIDYPDDVRLGRDIGSFSESIVELKDGKALFNYIAPDRLIQNDVDIAFTFYHETREPETGKTFTLTINPDPNQIVLTKYTLENSIPDATITMDINSSKLMSFTVKEDSATPNPVTDSNITSMKITMLNPALGTLENTDGARGSVLEIFKKNTVTVSINSKTISGIIPLKVEVTFQDANDESLSIVKIFNVVVLSGEPSAMSISYSGTSHDEESGTKFKEKMIIALTDEYGNRVDSKPALAVEMMAGYAKDSSGPYGFMYHENDEPIAGTLEKIIDDVKFKVDSGVVTKINITNHGSGYSVAPIVGIDNPGDGNFTAEAILNKYGSISNINVLNAGSSYTESPTITAIGKGSGFVGVAVLKAGGSLDTGISLDNAGIGYTSSPLISATGGNGAFSAIASLESTGLIRLVKINDGGSGYSVGDALTIKGDGKDANITVKTIDESGKITGINYLNRGSDYGYAEIESNGNADLSVHVGYSIKDINLISGGDDYTNTSLTITPSDGNTPLAEAKASGSLSYGLSSVNITSSGSGYENPTIIFTSTSGQDAFATATIIYSVKLINILNGGAGYTNGNLTFTNVGASVNTTATATVFDGSELAAVPDNGDYKIATFGNGYVYDASGKWDFTHTNAVNNYELVFKDDFNGSKTENLGFAVGKNKRQDACISGQEWVADSQIINGATFNSKGLAEIEISYDHYLVAKDVVIMVNLVGAQNSLNENVKIGEAIKHTLRGTGIEAPSGDFPAGSVFEKKRFYIELTDTTDNLKNSNFIYSVVISGAIAEINEVSDSMDNNIKSCLDSNNGDIEGRAYVDVYVTCGTACTVTLTDLIIASEF